MCLTNAVTTRIAIQLRPKHTVSQYRTFLPQIVKHFDSVKMLKVIHGIYMHVACIMYLNGCAYAVDVGTYEIRAFVLPDK